MIKLYILIVGNPVDGFQYTGPFATTDEVVSWAEQNFIETEWWIAELTSKD